jgi:diguanylate cyclase (GGDEF)-like protein
MWLNGFGTTARVFGQKCKRDALRALIAWTRTATGLLRDVCWELARVAPARVLWLLMLLPAEAMPAAGVVLAPDTDVARIWTSATMLADPAGAMPLDEVLARRAHFVPVAGPTENLGVRRGAVWLAVPVQLANGAPNHWTFSIDYPSMDEVDVYLLTNGFPVSRWRLGDSVAFVDRPLLTRPLAVPLRLEAENRYELLVRMRTDGTMIVPAAIWRPDRFVQRESGVQATQGLFGGVALCLLMFSLVNLALRRDRIFLFYAVHTAALSLFFLAYYGLAAQYFVPAQPWLAANAPPVAIHLAIYAASHFVSRSLDLSASHPRLGRTVEGIGWAALATCAAFLLGVVDYRLAATIGTALGPLPMLLALPVAARRAARGERPAMYLLAGWALMVFGIAIMVGLLRGWLPYDLVTGHSFQVGNLCEMLCWMFVLIERIERIRKRAEQAQREHTRMRRLATTDALTGLLNRRGLDAALGRALRESEGRCTAVFMIDLDGFKGINDAFGHAAGDRVLVEVGRRLRGCVRGTDIVGRPGGDEFIVVADLREPGDAARLGEKMLRAICRELVVAQRLVGVGATVGYALMPLDGTEPGQLLACADRAMYAAKQEGKRRVRRWLQAAEAA